MKNVFRFTDSCAGCGGCRSVCPAGCIDASSRPFRIDPEACTGCGSCAAACPIGAVEKVQDYQETP